MNNFLLNRIDDVVLVTINNVKNTVHSVADIFVAIGEAEINVDMICQTAPYKDRINLSFTIDNKDLAKTLAAVGQIKKTEEALITEVNGGNTKVTIFSECLKTEWGIAARLFKALGEHNLHIKLITTSDVEISILVEQSDADDVMAILEKEFN